MKRIWLLSVYLLISCMTVQAQTSDFDFGKYHKAMLEEAYPRFAKSTEPVRFKDYALIDVDGDGKLEVWVRGDDGQDYQGVFAIVGDSVQLLADADVCSELEFYKGAVGYKGYYSPGRVCEGASVVRNSRRAEWYWKEVYFNIFSDEQETESEDYCINDKDATEEDCEKFKEKLGDKITLEPVWLPVLE